MTRPDRAQERRTELRVVPVGVLLLNSVCFGDTPPTPLPSLLSLSSSPRPASVPPYLIPRPLPVRLVKNVKSLGNSLWPLSRNATSTEEQDVLPASHYDAGGICKKPFIFIMPPPPPFVLYDNHYMCIIQSPPRECSLIIPTSYLEVDGVWVATRDAREKNFSSS